MQARRNADLLKRRISLLRIVHRLCHITDCCSVLLQREGTKVPWKQILSKRPVWALILSHFCHNWGTFILLTWMPTYYNQVLGLDLMKSGFYSVLPWITMAIAANVGGWVADAMVARGVTVTRVRKIMQSVRTHPMTAVVVMFDIKLTVSPQMPCARLKQ